MRAEHLGERQHEVGGGGAGRQRAGHAHADHDRLRQEHRLAEHRGLGLDAADAPAQDAEPVDHRRVRVGADERVGERDAVARRDDLPEVLQVHLVADAGAGRHHAQPVERLLRPAQQRVPLAVAPVLELDVARRRPRACGTGPPAPSGRSPGPRGSSGLIDAGSPPARCGGAAHRGEVDHGGHAGEVLHQHAARHERDVARGPGPRGERAHVLVGDVARTGAPQQVLEQDQDGLRQSRRGRTPIGSGRAGTGRSGRRRSPTAPAPRRVRWSSCDVSPST